MPANAEILNYKKDGTPFWNELVIQPIVDGSGNILFTASFILDVTERKKDESLLKLQEKIFTGINAGVSLAIYCKKYVMLSNRTFLRAQFAPSFSRRRMVAGLLALRDRSLNRSCGLVINASTVGDANS